MIASAFFFSVMSALVKAAGQRLPSQEIVCARAIVSLALSYWLLRRAAISVWGTRRALLVLRGILGFMGLSCYYYAVTHLPLAEATVIQYVHPLITAFLAALVLSERIGIRLFLAIGVCFVGVVLIMRPAVVFGANVSSLDSFAVGMGFLGAFFSAAAYVVVRQLSRSEHSLVIVFYFPLIALPATIPGVMADFVVPTGKEWLLLLCVGVTTQLGQVFLTRGLRLEPAGRATAIGYSHIVFAVVWGALWFGEVPDGWTWAGALLVMGSILFFTLAKRVPRRA